MKPVVTSDNTTLNIALTEKLSFEDHNSFRELLDLLNDKKYKSCLIDLSGLESIDSAGLGMLMIARETADKTGAKLQLLKPAGQVKRLLEISEIDKIITIVP
ncbi:STAS domain-containing protein [Sneathiella limimaris]|uniref:STAS domain-containing protein n=1 Tax=Sneathiella limimaris TaxID=1964213 RepID=UPI00146C823F|nr:STAS domain-containing protein [Sneathiella limimaris]